ncbi:hypothetical protein OQA88_2396 [Cercophora sp. LCS_1]
MVCAKQYWLSMLYQNDGATFESISDRLDQVAASITTRIQSAGFTWQANDTPNPAIQSDRAFVTSTTTATSVCIQFYQRRLSLPTNLTFMTFGLLLISIFRTYVKRVASWKLSALPLPFHGFRGDTEGIPPDHRLSLPEMRHTARGVEVHFAGDYNGGYGLTVDRKLRTSE